MKNYFKYLNPISLSFMFFFILFSCNEDDDEREIMNEANLDVSEGIVSIDSGISIVGLGLTGQLTATIDHTNTVSKTTNNINKSTKASVSAARTIAKPAMATSKEVEWSSSDEAIATVDENGLVTGVSPGEVTITATSLIDSKILDKIIIKVSSGKSDITSFAINGVKGVINGLNINVTLPDSTDVRSLEPVIAHTGTSIKPGSKVAQDFTNPVVYTVMGNDGSALKWTASVSTGIKDENTDGAFVTTWSAQEITIPTDPAFTYNYSVDWDNDGTIDESGITGDVTHTFESDEEHTIRITGTFPAIIFGNLSREQAEKIISVDQWGNGEWLSMFDAFANCSNLEIPATDSPDLSKANRITRMFRNASSANPDVSGWNTGNVKYMNGLFKNASSANPDVSNWDISNIKVMRQMFEGSAISSENYGKALLRFAAHENDPELTLPQDVEIGEVPASFCGQEAQNAKEILLGKGWIINDQGHGADCEEELEGFITTWKAKEITIFINTTEGFTYNYNVDWDNDGTNDQTGITGDVTHTFEEEGEHTIRISGTFPAIRFAPRVGGTIGPYWKNAEKIISIDQWGTNEWLSFQSAFNKCINLQVKATDAPDLSKVTHLSRMFMESGLGDADFSHWNTSNVTNMSGMFANTNNAGNLGINTWNTSNVTDMSGMFADARYTPNVSDWNTSKVTNMIEMFARSAANPDMSNWNFSSLNDARFMFNGALGPIGLSQENYEKFLIRLAAHESEANLTLPEEIDLGEVPVSICSEEAQEAKTLLLSKGWTIGDQGVDPSCTDIASKAFVTTWKAKEITILINTIEGFTYNYNVDWDNDGTIDETGISGDITHTFGSFDDHTIRITGTFPAIRFGPRVGETLGPYLENAAKIISIDQWGTNEWLSFERAFDNCVNLQVNATDAPDLSNVTNLAHMFSGTGLVDADLNHWNTSNVTNMAGMFAETSSNPDVSNWNTSKVIQMGSMFQDAVNADPDLSKWDFSSVGRFRPTMDIVDIFRSSGISQENYEKFLIRLAAHESDPNLTLAQDIKLGDVPVSVCSEAAQKAKTLLLSKGWTIDDQGVDPGCHSDPAVVAEFRTKLSELNLFVGDMKSLTPSPRVFEYKLNTPLFTDYAKKQRLIAIPEGTAMTSNGDGLPDYPDNTVIAKTFYYLTLPFAEKKIIETRVLIKKNGEWITGNYKWNNAQTDATYTQSSSNMNITFIGGPDVITTVNYVIPGEDDCFTCHQTNGEITPIGPKLRNMNKVVNGKNQLQSLMDMQWLNGISHPSNISKLPDWEDNGETLENRARAYFEVNCAHCHTNGGVGDFLNLSFETPFNETPFPSEYYQGRIPEVIESGYMPKIGTTLVHEEGLDLVKEYLEGL